MRPDDYAARFKSGCPVLANTNKLPTVRRCANLLHQGKTNERSRLSCLRRNTDDPSFAFVLEERVFMFGHVLEHPRSKIIERPHPFIFGLDWQARHSP